MTTFFTATDQHTESLKTTAAQLLASTVQTVEAVGGGRNSQVYRLVVEPGRFYALKAYFRHPSDSRTRMETEFGSLTFLWENGVRNVPRPVIASHEQGLAIYQWIEGKGFRPEDVSGESIDAAISFLSRLAKMRSRRGAVSLGPASEAYFSGRAIVDNLRRRLEPLQSSSKDSDLEKFLRRKFIPALALILDWSRSCAGGAFDAELSQEARTLSPSDFGFHNALKNGLGETFFLDFEYFGWDDPAKTISDFLLHPAMALSPVLKQRFATSLVRELSSDGLSTRLRALYPLFGLKWCLILLNEFLPEHMLRRRFAAMSEGDQRQKQAEQLAKAENMLDKTLKEYEHFPYLD